MIFILLITNYACQDIILLVYSGATRNNQRGLAINYETLVLNG